jgi:hypothetical protein
MTTFTIRATRCLYILPRDCDVCGVTFDVGYHVVSDSGIEGDVCGPCAGKPKEEVTAQLVKGNV